MNLAQSRRFQDLSFWAMVLFEIGFLIAKLAGWTTWSWLVLVIAPPAILVLAIVIAAFFSGCGGLMLMMAAGFLLAGKVFGGSAIPWWVVLSPLGVLAVLSLGVLISEYRSDHDAKLRSPATDD